MSENVDLFRHNNIEVYKPIFRDGYAAHDIAIAILREGVIDDLYQAPWSGDAGEVNLPIDRKKWLEKARRNLHHVCEATHCKSLLISSEHLSFIRMPEEIDRLRSIIPEGVVKWRVIFFKREEEARWKSYCAQVVRSGIHQQQEVSAKKNSWCFLDDEGWLLDFEGFWTSWGGVAKIELVPYENNVLATLLETLDIGCEAVPEIFENKSVNRKRVSGFYRAYFSQTVVGSVWRSIKLIFNREHRLAERRRSRRR